MGKLNWIRLVFAWWSITSTVRERTELSMNMYSKTNLKLDEKLAWSPESKESTVCNIFSNWGYKAGEIYQNGHRNGVYKSIIFVCLDNKDLLLLVEDSDRCMLYITKYVR